jgi:hypothetical protein
MKWRACQEKIAVFIFTKDIDGNTFIREILDGTSTVEVGVKVGGRLNCERWRSSV